MKMYTAQEMRNMAEQILNTDDDWYEDAGYMLRQAADMMEREATSEKSSQVGNAAKMREALEQIHELLGIGGKPDTAMCIRYEAAYQMAKEALAAPPRNCDVLEVSTADDEFEKAMGFPPSKTADERDEIMRENWFLFKHWLFAEAKGETDGSK